jgi:integrase
MLRQRNWRRRVWRPAVASAGVPDLRFHDLRHSHAALLISAGTDPKTIAERLGHKSVRTVLDVYGHLYESADRQVADRLEEIARKT